jgi:hypothetical protein
MRQSIYLGVFWALLVVSPVRAADLGPGEVRKVEIVPSNDEIRVEITLSLPATPSVEVVQHPDRIVLKLPGTVSEQQQKRILVRQFGVRSVRFGLNQANPPETHLVVDLDQEHSYRILTDGTKITLIVETPLSVSARRRTAPAAAASRPLITTLGRGSDSSRETGTPSNQEGVLLTPPPSKPPIQFPPSASESTASSSTATSGQPSAKRPNTASLQQGTVFPTAGSPGTGVVPPVSDVPRPSGLNGSGTQVSANANVQLGSAEKPLPQEPKRATNASPETATAVRQDSIASLPPSSGQTVTKSDVAQSAVPKPAEVAGQPVAAASAPNTAQASAASVPPGSSVSANQKPAQNPAETSPPQVAKTEEPHVTAPAPATAESSSSSASPASTASVAPVPDDKLAQKPATSSTPAVGKAPEPNLVAAPDQTAAKTSSKNAADASSPNPAEVPAVTVAEESTPSAEGSGQGQAALPASYLGGNSGLRTAFRVKYVAQDAAYLDGGRAAGLTEGMKLVVRDLRNSGAVAAEGADSIAAGDVAELEILSVAETSSVTEIHTPKRSVKVGDLAYLSSADQQALVEKNALSATRKYPAVVSFTENDTLDDEARAEIPKPPLPSVNRARGRIGFDYIGVLSHDGSGMQSSNLGVVLRADITRINGTYWNVSGYWRGRLNSTTAGPQTLQDLINRTYHLYTTYDNPRSSWIAGFGRMYLPWATSLDTIDGGYFGRKVKPGVTTGLFLGSTPDPTSYSYAPNREIGGAFVNFEGGSYDNLHYSSTSGAGLKMQKWSVDRPFVFLENGIFYKRIFSIYQSMQLDSPSAHPDQPAPGPGIGRSFVTLRIQPHPRVEFSFNHTYFRDLPTFDPNLIGTGLLDKYLFQGFSAGTRVEVYKQIWLSADLGLSNRTGDKNNSLNQMFGITFGRLPWINMHASARYSRFTSSFGSGSYEALSLSKNLGETLQLQILAGQQNFASSLSSANISRFVNGTIETALGEHYFMQAGGTINRGNQMNYDQWMFTFGYRFDNRHGHRGQ